MRITYDFNSIRIEDIGVTELYLQARKERLTFKKEKEIFSITIKELLCFFTEENCPLHFINENGQLIDSSFFQKKVEFHKNNYLNNEERIYYVYIDKNDLLTIVFKTKPSIFNLYSKNCEITNIDKTSFEFYFKCKYFKPIAVVLYIKSRNKKIEISSNELFFEIIDEDENFFRVKVRANINADMIEKLESQSKSIKNYNVEAYDLHFSYRIKEFPLSDYPPRIKFNDKKILQINDEVWGEANEREMFLLRLYPTKQGNLSCRIFLVPKLTYNYYLSMHKRNKKEVREKKPVIICVEYPEKAQDNSFVFFKYLLTYFGDKINVYYLLADNSKDIKNIKGFEDNIIQYQSSMHLILFEKADIVVHSHTPNYVLPFFSNFLEEMLDEKQKVFLQHGIIGSKDVSSIYGRETTKKFTDLFVVSSDREKKEVIKNYNYSDAEVILTGLARFDNIIKFRNLKKDDCKNKTVLIMPTWQKGLDNLSDRQFRESNFFKIYNSFITNPQIANLISDEKYEFKFYLHHNFQKYTHLFDNRFVQILTEDSYNVSELLRESKLLVTDYSSVGLDFSLMYKKVIYYRPDEIVAEETSKQETNFLPGKIVKIENDLISEIQILDQSEEYRKLLHYIYKFNDSNACQRIMGEMIQKLDIKIF